MEKANIIINRSSLRSAAIAALVLLDCASSKASTQHERRVPAAVLEDVATALSDGGPQPFAPRGMIRAVDVNMDGVTDWLIDYAQAGETIWCGTGGCRYKLFVSSGIGRHVVAFDETARRFDIRRSGRIDVDVYGTYCGSFGADECRRSFVWSSAQGMLLPVLAKGQQPWLFGPLFSPVVTDRQTLPGAVASAVSRRAAACAAKGGTLDEADGAIVRSPDLDGDGQADWIIGSPFSACVPEAGGTDEDLPEIARPTLVVISGANEAPLYEGQDANYAIDIAVTPARLMIVPDDEERLLRCAGQATRCGGTAVHLRASRAGPRTLSDSAEAP